MSPHLRKIYLITTSLIVVVFSTCLLIFADQGAPPIPVPEEVPLGSLVRLYRVETSWFPVVLMEVQRHRQTDKKNWDIFLRVVTPEQVRIWGHLRLGDQIPRTDFLIKDVSYQKAGEDRIEAGIPGSSITVEADGHELILYENRPARAPDSGTVHELVYFPATPLRGLSSSLKIRNDAYFTLRAANRSETYHLQVAPDGTPWLQQVRDGIAVGAPILVPSYQETEHVAWLRRHR